MPPGLYQSLSSAALALTLAILIWIAATNIDLEQLVFPPQPPGLPITLVNLSPGLIVTEGEGQFARVALRIPVEQIDALESTDLRIQADLTGLGPGVHQVAVTVEPQPFAPPFRLLELTPDSIIVELDEVITRTLPIELEIADLATLPQTFQVLTTTVEPPTVTLAGPRGVVESVERVAAVARIGGAREPVVQTVAPQLVSADGSLTTSALELSTAQVTATLGIELRPGYRNLIVGTEIQGEPAPGYWVSGVSLAPPLVTVVGQPDVVSTLNSVVSTEPIDVEGQEEGTITRNVRLQLPEGVSPLDEGLVQVTVQIEPQTSSKRVNVRPVVTGLGPDQVVAEADVVPATVTVLLTGPVTELETVSLDEVVVTLDVADRPMGTHLIEPTIKPPGTLRAESISPEVVEVTIREKEVVRPVEAAVRVTGMAPGTVAVVTPPTVTLSLVGPVSEVAAMVAAGLRPMVELARREVGTYQLAPTIALSGAVALAEPLEPLLVNIYNEADVISLAEPVTVVGLEPGLNATPVPTMARLRVAGPGDATALRRAGGFAIQANAAGLGEGEHEAPLVVRLPEGYSLVDVAPERVRLRLETSNEG